MIRLHDIACFALPALAIFALERAGAMVALGAHPWWSFSGAASGFAIGFGVLALIALTSRYGRISNLLLALVFGGLALVAVVLMLNGKEIFAMSYASDVVAGRFWHFGYIGFVAALYAELVSACRAIPVWRTA